MSIEAMHRKGYAPRPNFKRSRSAEFVPDTDGLVSDVVSSAEIDELAEYAAELAELEVDIADDDQGSDSLLPTADDSDNLPWD